MPHPYLPGPGGTWLRPGLAEDLRHVDTLVFDMDGVLVDTSGSYTEAVCQAVQTYFSRCLRWPGDARLITLDEIALFKRAGGFNSDWYLAQAVVLFYLAKAARLGGADLAALRQAPPSLAEFAAAVAAAGGGLAAAERLALAGLPAALAEGVRRDWDRALIDRLCMEAYGGEDWAPAMFGITPRYLRGPGLCNRERPLVDAGRILATGRRVGVYTGRERAEAQPALQLCGLAGVAAGGALVTSDQGIKKPDPEGLRRIIRHLGGRAGLFFGDNVDDAHTVLRYRQEAAPGDPPFYFCGVLGGVLGEGAEAAFRELGADLIAPSVHTALAVLPPLAG